MNAPTIEFLIPFHGEPGYLRETVASLLAQDDERWSAIIVDDHFPDADAAAHAAGGDPRVRVVRNARNLGANGNYRKSLELATADFVVILGADDRLLPGYVARVRPLAASTGATVVQPGVRVIDAVGNAHRPLTDAIKSSLRPRVEPGIPVVLRGDDAAASVLRGNWTYFPSLCWSRTEIERIGFRSYDVVQDLALLVDIFLAGGALAVDDDVVFEYRRHAASDSAVRAVAGSRFTEERAYFGTIAKELAARGWRRASRSARLRPMSRAHALTLLPHAVRRDWASAGRLARHAMGT